MKKIFIILPVLLLFIGVTVKASTLGDIDLRIPDNLKDKRLTYYAIFNSIDDKCLFLSENKAVIKESDEMCQISVNGPYALYKLREEDQTWHCVACSGNNNAKYQKPILSAIANNYNIYNEDGTLVFQRAPIKVSFIERMRTLEMGATLTTLVSLVPLLMALVTSFLAFRKAWAWFLKVLRKS